MAGIVRGCLAAHERMVQMTSHHQSPYFHTNSVGNLLELDLITGRDDSVILENPAAARKLAAEIKFHQVIDMCNVCQEKLDLRIGNAKKAHTTFRILGARNSQPEAVYLSLENPGELANKLCDVEQAFHWQPRTLLYPGWDRNLVIHTKPFNISVALLLPGAMNKQQWISFKPFWMLQLIWTCIGGELIACRE
jgi:hypothetical protein